MQLDPCFDPAGLAGRESSLALGEDFAVENVHRGLMALIPDMNVRLRVLAASLAYHANDNAEEHGYSRHEQYLLSFRWQTATILA